MGFIHSKIHITDCQIYKKYTITSLQFGTTNRTKLKVFFVGFYIILMQN